MYFNMKNTLKNNYNHTLKESVLILYLKGTVINKTKYH
jgi:hypothetical protein